LSRKLLTDAHNAPGSRQPPGSVPPRHERGHVTSPFSGTAITDCLGLSVQTVSLMVIEIVTIFPPTPN